MDYPSWLRYLDLGWKVLGSALVAVATGAADVVGFFPGADNIPWGWINLMAVAAFIVSALHRLLRVHKSNDALYFLHTHGQALSSYEESARALANQAFDAGWDTASKELIHDFEARGKILREQFPTVADALDDWRSEEAQGWIPQAEQAQTERNREMAMLANRLRLVRERIQNQSSVDRRGRRTHIDV